MSLCPGKTETGALQSQKTQGFCVADFATLSDEKRSRSKIVLLFFNPIRPGGGLRGPDGQTHSCQSETSYPMMPKLGDFQFLSLRHLLATF